MKISRKEVLQTLIGSFALFPVLAKNKAPQRTAVAEFLESHKRSREYTLSVFEQMPQEGMDFKPSPEMFTFHRHFTHCIEFTAGQLTNRLKITDPFAAATASKWNALTKAEIKQELVRFYDWVESTVNEGSTFHIVLPISRPDKGVYLTKTEQ